MSRVFAVVPAAGKSSRMGRPKLSLPLGKSSVIEHVVATLREAQLEDVVVVVSPQVTSLVPLVEKAGGHALVLRQQTPDMRASVLKGLDWLEARHHPTAQDDWLLIPADHPVLEASIVRELLQAKERSPEKSIFVPFHQKRGHPTLISWKHVEGIRATSAHEGINVYLRAQSEAALEVPVTSSSVLIDLDTPEDYEQILRRSKIPGVLWSYVEGLKAHDVDRIAETVADDLAFVTIDRVLNKSQFLQMLRALYAGFPDWHYDHDAPEVRENHFAIRRRQAGTHTGTFALPGRDPIAPTGKLVTIPAHYFYYCVRDNKIVEIRPEPVPGGAPAGILRQIGADVSQL